MLRDRRWIDSLEPALSLRKRARLPYSKLNARTRRWKLLPLMLDAIRLLSKWSFNCYSHSSRFFDGARCSARRAVLHYFHLGMFLVWALKLECLSLAL
ncbi:hypothetical protein GALMADRAFT_484445 [Galerina marginata CBS 339.88]|uniref:Uncharacterized protein n=1 Tax=Galerina marginata (strain CBS 339.88) TaxID=685588 RepID=A0A067T6H7_GALM3|nr:hypothetical protein GALMADRAFT_484445 [Galerina marginata CBS 339.88]